MAKLSKNIKKRKKKINCSILYMMCTMRQCLQVGHIPEAQVVRIPIKALSTKNPPIRKTQNELTYILLGYVEAKIYIYI